MGDSPIWHGTEKEANDLLEIIRHNCECKYGVMGVRTTTCAAHTALVSDQRFLDGLVYAHRIKDCLERKEFSEK